MSDKEATARIKINKLLEAAGWRFFPEGSAPANIRLEPSVTITSSDLEALGENFEKTSKGFIDFLLLDTKGFPLIVLEAKAEDKNSPKPTDAEAIPAIKNYFKAYVTSDRVRDITESRHFTDLATNSFFDSRAFKAVPPKYRTLIPNYIKDYVSLNQFTV